MFLSELKKNPVCVKNRSSELCGGILEKAFDKTVKKGRF